MVNFNPNNSTPTPNIISKVVGQFKHSGVDANYSASTDPEGRYGTITDMTGGHTPITYCFDRQTGDISGSFAQEMPNGSSRFISFPVDTNQAWMGGEGNQYLYFNDTTNGLEGNSTRVVLDARNGGLSAQQSYTTPIQGVLSAFRTESIRGIVE